MSLPWKKSKSSRISRFMSEFQQSPKRGGSLVVETGFPTSLIDLFVKNRDRLKKSSSKRQTQTAPNASSPINPDAILAEKPTKKVIVENKIEKVHFVGDGFTAENNQKRCVCACGVGGSGSCVLTAFKVLIVALLALSTKKKFTLGITLSTLALLLTELVAARVFTRLKLCKNEMLKEKPAVSVHDKNVTFGEKTESFDDISDCRGEETESISCLKVTEPVVAEEKPCSKIMTVRDLLSKDEKSKSKTSRLKSKIVKKLRSCKKKKETVMIKEESLSDVSSLVSDDKSEEMIESEREEKESKPPLMGSKGANTNGIVVIVIVLTGLLSGKMFAIVLTLSCLFLRFEAAKRFGRCI